MQDLIDEWAKIGDNDIVINDKIQRYFNYIVISQFVHSFYRMTLDIFGKAIFNIEFKVCKNNIKTFY